MHLARYDRRRYTQHPTPLEPMPHLTDHLGGAELWVKRDDLLGLAGGGNKTRKLEFLVADALARGADTLITTGAVQSNHCRLTLAAAVREGLACRLVLEERVPDSYDPDASGNNFLYRLLGVEQVTVVSAGTDLAAAMQVEAEALEREGRSGYVIPGGGSTPLGALGYVACAEEILAQAFEAGVVFDHIVTASGSGGTHAGILAGIHGTNARIPVTGISVRADKKAQEAKIAGLARATCELMGVTTALAVDAVEVLDDYVGPGYSLPTAAMGEAIRLFARQEGILLDPVYTGKAAAGLLDMVRKDRFAKGARVLFLHTGGSPALYAYRDDVLD